MYSPPHRFGYAVGLKFVLNQPLYNYSITALQVAYDVASVEIYTSKIMVHDDLPDLLKGLLQRRLEFTTQEHIETYEFKTKKAQDRVAKGLRPSGARVLLSDFGSEGGSKGGLWSPIANMPLEFRDLSKAGRLAKAKEVIAKSLEDKEVSPSRAPVLVGNSEGGKLSAGKRRPLREELNGEKKAKKSKENDAGKETRSMQQAQLFKCPRKGCIYDCRKGARMRDMASHLKEFILCRTDESVRDCGICQGAMKKTKK